MGGTVTSSLRIGKVDLYYWGVETHAGLPSSMHRMQPFVGSGIIIISFLAAVPSSDNVRRCPPPSLRSGSGRFGIYIYTFAGLCFSHHGPPYRSCHREGIVSFVSCPVSLNISSTTEIARLEKLKRVLVLCAEEC